MHSTHEAELDIPGLPLAARKVHIVPDLASHSLLSIGQLCDAGCDVTFTTTDAIIRYQLKTVLQGHRTPATGLWHLDISSNPAPLVMEAAHASIGTASPADLVAFAHGALFSPTLSTLGAALTKGFITNFPGLTVTTLRKHPPVSAAMVKGHLDQSRQNQRSTKPDVIPVEDAPDLPQTDDDPFPAAPADGARSHYCYLSVMEPTSQIYTDQTGRFVTPSSNGNNYLMVLYDYDSNCILAEPMKNRTGKSILAAYKALHTNLCAAGLRPQLGRLDNEWCERRAASAFSTQ
jgi:hypothetical protein